MNGHRKPCEPRGKVASLRRPVEDLVGDGQQVEVTVGDLEQGGQARGQAIATSARAVEHRPELALEVVGQPLQEPGDEAPPW